VVSYWFVVFNPSTWTEFTKMDDRYLGFGEASLKKLKSVKEGDLLIAYVCKSLKFTGVYKCTGPVVRKGMSIWGTVKFPYCLPVEIVGELSLEKGIEFYSVCDTQSWYKKLRDRRFWSFAFRTPPKKLDPRDAVPLIKLISES